MSEVLNMSGIMMLRTLICENITATHAYHGKPQFLLAYDPDDEIWTVKVGHGWSFNPRAGSGYTLMSGRGKTPELAYQDILEDTAMMVSNGQWEKISEHEDSP